MKTITIDLGALFPAGLTAFQDGDTHQETNTDLVAQDMADALGWLKNVANSSALLSGNNTWTGTQTFSGSPFNSVFSSGTSANFDGEARIRTGGAFRVLSGGSAQVEGGSSLTVQSGASVSLAADMTMTGKLTKSGAAARIVSSTRQAQITESNFTAGADYDHVRMTITSGTSRSLTMKIASLAPVQGERCEVRRDGGGAGVLVVINEGIAGSIVEFSDDGGCTLVFDGDQWRLHGYYNGNPGASA